MVVQKYIHFKGNFVERESTVGSQINVEDAFDKFYIEFLTDLNNLIRFELLRPTNGTIIFKIIDGEYFTKEKLKQLALETNIDIVENSYGGLDISIPTLSNQWLLYPLGAEIMQEGKCYLCIYTTRGHTNFFDGIYYIHGIYEISESLLSVPRRYDGTQWVPI